MGIETKSLGFLIDQLITTDLRCWFAQEDIMNESLSEHERLQAAIKAQEQNSLRSKLIKAIDDMTNQEFSMGGDKTYTYFKEKK
jgi:hypothetical protein